MIRIFISIALLFAAVFAFDLLGDVPVTVALAWPGGAAAPPFRVVVVALLVIAALSILLWKIVSGLMRAPGGIRGYFRGRRRDRGYRALSRGMIAVGSGDYRLAQGEAAEATRLIPNEPMVMLLGAQAAQLEGRSDAARAAFTRMLADPSTRLLGLRGLYIEASRAGESEAARQYAAEAHRLRPGIPWAGTAMMEALSASRDWQGALAVLDAGSAGRLRDKGESRRLRAVLLTARALEAEDGEPEKARTAALEAHRIAPELVPAAAVAARLSARLGDLKRAAKVIETAWKANPHPELASAYLYLRSGDSALDRLKRARFLEGSKPYHAEGAVAVARAAIDARELALARQELAKALRQAPTERVCLMMAELEEVESGDAGRVREWLGRAVRAPRDAAWTADGVVLEHWQPVSPVTGRLDAVEWRVPVTADGGVTELDGTDLAERAAVAYVPPPAEAQAEPATEPAESPEPQVSAIEPEPEDGPVPEPSGSFVEASRPPDDPGPANGHGLRRSLEPESPFR
jgi:HemY protein